MGMLHFHTTKNEGYQQGGTDLIGQADCSPAIRPVLALLDGDELRVGGIRSGLRLVVVLERMSDSGRCPRVNVPPVSVTLHDSAHGGKSTYALQRALGATEQQRRKEKTVLLRGSPPTQLPRTGALLWKTFFHHPPLFYCILYFPACKIHCLALVSDILSMGLGIYWCLRVNCNLCALHHTIHYKNQWAYVKQKEMFNQRER
jgi:hypothetical protein